MAENAQVTLRPAAILQLQIEAGAPGLSVFLAASVDVVQDEELRLSL